MMDAAALEAYLHRHIPISREMGIRVLTSDDEGVRLGMRLEPNLNHQRTAFGGSIASLAILAGWSVGHTGLRAGGRSADLVIQRSHLEYLEPITGPCEAFCPRPSPGDWQRFLNGLDRRGRGRIRLSAEVLHGDAVAAAFEGAYVALGADDAAPRESPGPGNGELDEEAAA